MDEAHLRDHCSLLTLVSQKEGFFYQWATQIESTFSHTFITHFQKLTTDQSRIQTLWGQECVHSLKIQSFLTGKNLSVADERRRAGNKAFQDGDYEKAVKLYSQSVIRSPTSYEGLSLALANRSAALFHLAKFELCLQDISLALLKDYPNRLRYKVYNRRGQCLAKMGRGLEAKVAFQAAIDSLESSELSKSQRQEWGKELNPNVEKSENSTSASDENHIEKDEEIPKDKLYKGNSAYLPKASSALCVKYSEESGRFMAASEDIPGGKVLVRERPFCSVLMQEKRGTFCEHCFKYLVAPIPCESCSGVAFCSPECRDEAQKTYHKWECPYLNLFKASGMSLNCFLALRVITERGMEFFKRISSRIKLECLELPSKQTPHNPDDYCSFYNLIGQEKERPGRGFLQRTLMAVFLLKVIQHAGFFPDGAKEEMRVLEMSEDERLAGSLLLRHLQMIQFNAHEVSGIAFEGEKSFRRCKSVFVGLAVYPTVSFFNHSCVPAVGRYFDGKEMSIVSLRPLRKGQVVPENYGPIFTHNSLEDRRKKLSSRYWFSCNCEACTNDWPKYDTMPTNIILSSPQAEQGRPTKNKKHKRKQKNRLVSQTEDESSIEPADESCNVASLLASPDSPLKQHKDFELGQSLMDEFKREEAIAAFLRWVTAAAPRVQLPLKDFHLALEALRLLVAARGSHYVVAAPPQ